MTPDKTTIPADAVRRFEAKVDRTGACHRWTAGHNANGYGIFGLRGGSVLAHRMALLIAGVEIPRGLTVDHVWVRGCRHKDCVRVDHLEVVPNPENVHRAMTARTACRRGHPYTADDSALVREGDRVRRRCRVCARERTRKGPQPVRDACSQGHPLSGDNLYVTPSRPTWRVCRTCKRQREIDRAAERQTCDQGHPLETRTNGRKYCPPCQGKAVLRGKAAKRAAIN